MAKSNNLERAIAVARGTTVPDVIDASGLQALSAETMGLLRPADPQRYIAASQVEGVQVGERQVAIAAGMQLGGILMATSVRTIASTRQDEEPTQAIAYHMVLDSGARVRLLGLTQIDDGLRGVPADGTQYVVIIRTGESVETRAGRDVDIYYVQSAPLDVARAAKMGTPFIAARVTK